MHACRVGLAEQSLSVGERKKGDKKLVVGG